MQKGRTSVAAFQAHLPADLYTCLSKNSVDRTKLPFLFGLQDPPVYKGKIVGFGNSLKFISSNKNGDPWAAIYSSRSLHIWPMMEFCDRDPAVGLWKMGNNNIDEIIVVSVCTQPTICGAHRGIQHGTCFYHVYLTSRAPRGSKKEGY